MRNFLKGEKDYAKENFPCGGNFSVEIFTEFICGILFICLTLFLAVLLFRRRENKLDVEGLNVRQRTFLWRGEENSPELFETRFEIE